MLRRRNRKEPHQFGGARTAKIAGAASNILTGATATQNKSNKSEILYVEARVSFFAK
jgi:hypothetical protein